MYKLIKAMYHDNAGDDLVVEVNTVTGGVIKGLLNGVTEEFVAILERKPPRTYGDLPTYADDAHYVALQHVVYIREV